MRILLCVVCLFLSPLSSAYIAPPRLFTKTPPPPPTSANVRAPLGTRLYLFERFTSPSINCLVASQAVSAEFGQSEVSEIGFLCGISEVVLDDTQDDPGLLELRKLLRAQGLSPRAGLSKLATTYLSKSSSSPSKPSFNKMFTLSQKSRDVELPFSSEVKSAMKFAGEFDIRSDAIHPENLLHGLFHSARPDGHLALFLDSVSEGFSPADFAATLASNIEADVYGGARTKKDKKELATGGSQDRKTPTLEECGVDLTEKARAGELDAMIGRSAEVRAALRTLVRRRKNNPCLVGEPGVGKTAIAEGLAILIADEDECPKALQGARVVSLEMSTLVAGTKYRGEFEER